MERLSVLLTTTLELGAFDELASTAIGPMIPRPDRSLFAEGEKEPTMRKVITKVSVSIDGFMGGPNGEIDWMFRSRDESGLSWILAALRSAGVHIMGRKTFQDMAAYWPYSTEPLAAPMNEIPKVLFSRTHTAPPTVRPSTKAFEDATRAMPVASDTPALATWTEARVARGDLAEEIRRMKAEPGKDILAHGGASFLQSLAGLDLIDEYRLLVHPVVLGRGLPVFSARVKPADLTLVEAQSFPRGAVGLVYRR